MIWNVYTIKYVVKCDIRPEIKMFPHKNFDEKIVCGFHETYAFPFLWVFLF